MTTEEYLINAPLPEETETYTVISHKTVIEATRKTLQAMGFEIEREQYRCNIGAQVATGVYHLKYSSDPDIGMLFAWANSYDKSMKFKCSIGGYVHESLASIISGNMGSWGRKHTGNADDEALQRVENQLMNAEEYFKNLLKEKDLMKTVLISKDQTAELLGKMYFNNELLTTEQMSVVKQELAKPSFKISGEEGSLWKMYHAIIIALQKSHPKTWIDQQAMVHKMLVDEFKLNDGTLQNSIVTVSEPQEETNQLDIETVIKEVEAEQAMTQIIDMPSDEVEAPVIEEIISEVPEIAPQAEVEITFQDDDGWPCLKCGTMQSATSIWHDGQLCATCYNEF